MRVYEWTPGFCHAKMSVVDDCMATCGTINLDYRSLYHHFENGCFMADNLAVLDIRNDLKATMELLKNDEKPIYVAVDEDNVCVGYAFCQLQEQPFSNNMVPFKSLFIDDLCVSQETRGRHIGECLFEYVKNQAKQLGCYEVTLNVWAGNTSAERFYEKMGMRTKERQMEYIL